MLQPPDTANVSPYVPSVDPIAPLRAALRGHYDIEREIGQGAFATVYLARDLKHERKVALKVLTADPTSDTGELRFIREIRTLARLQHPNILPLHDSGHVEALLYYVMPYVSGDTLRDRIDRERQMPVEAACSIARDVADALSYAHGQGIVHRDIKPENILLSTGHPILADFGIARAIDLAGVRQLTKTGAASPGTPAYMSPEQLMGDKDVDGRTDTYSLGCVLFEMLTGKPPFAGKEGFVKRFTEPPPKASTFRKGLPAWVDIAIDGALQRAPQDRYTTPREFIAALCPPPRVGNEFGPGHLEPAAPIASASPTTNSSSPGMWPATWLDAMRSRPKAFGGMGVALIAAAIALTAGARPSRLRAIFNSPSLDSTKFAVLPPIRAADPTAPPAEHFGDRMYEALRSWAGLKLVTDLEVEDALRERGHPPVSLTEALSVSRSLGAGRLVWGRVVGAPGSRTVRAEVYDVARGASTGRMALIDTAANADQLGRAVIALISVPNRPRVAESGDALTRSYPAWTEYNLAHVALAAWDLDSALRHFEQATVGDPDFPLAHLWLAQLRAWRVPGRPVEWQDHASRAASASLRLTSHDALIAKSLVDLAKQDYPAACSAYGKMTAADSLDFVGWYGLGECQSLDSLVIRAASSPSGWNFRSSSRRAAAAYMRALELQPRAHALLSFDRLRGLLPTAGSKVRGGHNAGPRSEPFAASPSLMGPGETLAFVPYPRAKFAALPPEAISSLNAALEQNTGRLYQFARVWTSESPNDAAAFEALADILDTRGQILGDGRGPISALGAISKARVLSTEHGQRLRTATKEVWIRFKRREFSLARALADSLLRMQPDPSDTDARLLIGLAAVTGNISRTRELVRLTGWYSGGTNSTVPDGVSYPAAQLFAFATFGVCDDQTLRQLRGQLDDALDRYVQPTQVATLRESLLARPRSMLSPCTNGQSALEIAAPRALLVRMQQALAKGDTRTLRALLESLAAVAALQRPGDLSADYIYQQAWLRAAVGDTLAAIRQLDRTLEGLPAVSTTSLQEPVAAAGIIQAMALRADLAAAQGDTRTAARWANGVATMWDAADPPLKPLIVRMRTLAARQKS